jgi:hypothetical protein
MEFNIDYLLPVVSIGLALHLILIGIKDLQSFFKSTKNKLSLLENNLTTRLTLDFEHSDLFEIIPNDKIFSSTQDSVVIMRKSIYSSLGHNTIHFVCLIYGVLINIILSFANRLNILSTNFTFSHTWIVKLFFILSVIVLVSVIFESFRIVFTVANRKRTLLSMLTNDKKREGVSIIPKFYKNFNITKKYYFLPLITSVLTILLLLKISNSDTIFLIEIVLMVNLYFILTVKLFANLYINFKIHKLNKVLNFQS